MGRSSCCAAEEFALAIFHCGRNATRSSVSKDRQEPPAFAPTPQRFCDAALFDGSCGRGEWEARSLSRLADMRKITNKESNQLTRFARSIVRLHGGAPEEYTAAQAADGTVRVQGPSAAACYSCEGWTTKFIRHLRSGFFDAVESHQQPAYLQASGLAAAAPTHASSDSPPTEVRSGVAI